MLRIRLAARLVRFVAATVAPGFCLAPAAALAQSPAAPAPSSSQPPRISQDVFVTASLSDVPVSSLSRTTVVVTREQLELLGITSIVDGLRLVPGIDPRARGPRDVQTDFSIRGATFGQSLVLVDGFRLNDAQTGHHNGEIPNSAADIDRIEVVYGAGSAVHGADALGGTINVISRKGPYSTLGFEAGQHGYVSAQGGVSGGRLPAGLAVNGWGSRSSGFMTDRDFALGGASVRGDLGRGMSFDVRHQRRAFGANGFYGNSPSKEWTDLTMAGAAWKHSSDRWVATIQGHVRQHHDHFLWNVNVPGVSENRHRTNATEVEATVERVFRHGVRVTAGASGGGDWVRSSNLGNHDYRKVSVFGEAVLPVASRATLQGGVRLDDYSTFGRSASPSISFVINVSPSLRVHTAVSHAFRVPTFTELYYTDPANQGSADLRAEQGWSYDAGIDWSHAGWAVSVSPFRRDDTDVIDWTRATTSDKWNTHNVRDVTTTGVEMNVSRTWASSLVRAYASVLDVDAPSLTTLSKYALEYARRQAGGSVSLPVVSGIRVAMNLDYRDRLVGGAAQKYTLLSARVSKSLPHADVFVDASNLTGRKYNEILGVAMPGRWMTVGVTLR